MSDWQVMIVALGGHAAQAETVRRRLEGQWNSATTIALANVDPAEIYAVDLSLFNAAIIIGDCAISQAVSSGLVEVIEDAGVPMLTLIEGEITTENFFSFAGAMVAPLGVSDAHLAGLLQGILHRQEEVSRLRSEAALAQRFQGGLKGQIAKMHEELQLAAMVQREFLPRQAPTVHGVEFATMWRPTNYVSGDSYDLIRLDEDRIGVFIADAVGHGVPAALMTMVICRSLTTKEIVNGRQVRILPPSEAMARLNSEMIRRQGGTTRFATAVYAVIDCRRRTVQLTGAGHPPPLVLRGDGSMQAMETSGGLLGIFEDETYPQIEFALDAGDRLLFYTDGFEQAFPAAADQHGRRVPTTQYRLEFDQLRRFATAAEMIDSINERLNDQKGSLHQIDDLTMICTNAGPLASVDHDADASVDQDADAGREHVETAAAALSIPPIGLRLVS